ncbi:MAG: L-2-amino-thiazoline-4-carboxylic acid hydrolase [Deltaproteobacteria bacterium]|jgi:hypothetical protein|nr:L-2-amino-thiazoline-4-carboxylic acid hydrolase [Deltaproteobacteria bacterium]
MSVSLLERRRIEGEIVKAIYDVLVEELGPDKTQDVVGRAVQAAAAEAGRREAEKVPGGADLESLAALQPLWTSGGALETRILAAGPERFDYDVVRCRYAEMYRDMGLGELGFLLSCGRDEAFVAGYAPGVELTRTKTIMQGDGLCDFRYRAARARS